MSYNILLKHVLFMMLSIVLIASCTTNADRKPKERSFSIKQLYSTGELPPTDEADRFIITGTIDEIDLGGSFVVNTLDGDKVAMTFHPEQMQASELASFNSYLLKGNKVKCVGTKIDPGVYALLAAKITQQ